MEGSYISVEEAAARAGVSRAAIYLAVREGRIPYSVVVGKIALLEADVGAYRPVKSRKPGEPLYRQRRRHRAPTTGAAVQTVDKLQMSAETATNVENRSPTTGAELLALWDAEGVGEAWSRKEIADSAAYARELRSRAEARA